MKKRKNNNSKMVGINIASFSSTPYSNAHETLSNIGMEKYLQILVIVLPALAITMGGLLLITILCLQSWKKISANLRILQNSVTTQSNGSLQMNHEIRDKLVEEAMARVKMFLSEEFQKNQVTKVSQEEFNKLYKTQQTQDSRSSADRTDERQKCQEMNFVCNTPSIAPLTNYTSITASLKKTDSFATLWVEELQRSEDIHSMPPTERESRVPKSKPTVENLQMQPQHSLVTYRDSSSTGLNPASQHYMLTQVELKEATKMIEVKPSNQLSLIYDLEMFLLTASSNLSRSLMALSKEYKPESGMSVSSNKEICMRPKHNLELGPIELPSMASISMNAPQLLKGGASQDCNSFVWRLDIEDNCAEPSPPNTPMRHRPPSHLCRGVQFQVAEHPPAMNIIHLEPEQGYGWRGPNWKETFGKHHIYKEHGGPSEYRKRRQNLASTKSRAQYYKWVEVDARRKWKTVKERYRGAKNVAAIKIAIREDIQRSAEWKRHLRESVISESSSANTSEREIDKRRRKKKDNNMVKSMLATSSSSLDSDNSVIFYRNQKPRCKRKYKHCKFENPRDSY